MIRVERSQKDENGNPVQPDTDWFARAKAKTAQAIQETQDSAIGKHKADKGVYGDVKVRMALEKLFHSKCAYCETKLTENGWDIEHYRPKGRVTENPAHPGYYWLTYTWENLLPSCPFCNQSRQDVPLWDDPRPLPSGGKYDQFPLFDETKRVHAPGSIASEEPLLLNPCEDWPEDHFKYTPLGTVVEVDQGERLKATVRICHLQRRRLRDARVLVVQKTLEALETLELVKAEGNPSSVTAMENWIKKYLLSDGCIHAGVARDVVRDPGRFTRPSSPPQP